MNNDNWETTKLLSKIACFAVVVLGSFASVIYLLYEHLWFPATFGLLVTALYTWSTVSLFVRDNAN